MTEKKPKPFEYTKILFSKFAWLLLFLVTYGIFWFRLPPQVPLYYSQALREDRLADSYALLILPAVVFMTFIICERFLSKLALKNGVILRVVEISSVVMAAFAYVLFLKILLLVA
ncbi:MAG: hypothetical protein WC775_02055 [Patescibacteria group bacterium]|jgi:hypothetical protein